MTKHLRPLAMFACITAATALGGQLAFANDGSSNGKPEAKCGEQHRQGEHRQGHRGHRFFKKMAKELGLSDQQKSQAKALLQADRAQNKPLFQALMKERHELRTLTLFGSADEAAIRAQAAKVASVQADLAVKRAQEAKQLMALLTPEQVTKLRTILDKHDQKFKKFRSGEEGEM